jgi:hypothetical protein
VGTRRPDPDREQIKDAERDIRRMNLCGHRRLSCRHSPDISAPSVCLPEIAIPSAYALSVTFQNSIAAWSFCLRVSGAVAPSAPEISGLSHIGGSTIARGDHCVNALFHPIVDITEVHGSGLPRGKPQNRPSLPSEGLQIASIGEL